MSATPSTGRTAPSGASTAGAPTYAVTNPATGELITTFPTATDEEVRAAVAAAHDAYSSWGRTSTVTDRAALVRCVAELHTERRDALAVTIHREMGKPLEDALTEID